MSEVDVVRSWKDGRYTFVHGIQRREDGAYVTTDFIDADDDGRVLQRWGVSSEIKGLNPSGRTQLDGATEIEELDRTEANKALVKHMLEDCLFPGARPDAIEEYFAEDYLQHNPNVPDGLAIVRELALGQDRTLVYNEIVLLVGRGNFVATLCNVTASGVSLAQVDILRLEDGKIVEHWDNYERV